MKFPYNGWVLTPTFNVKQVAIVGAAWGGGRWHKSDTGKTYDKDSIFSNREAAIKFGELSVAEQQAKLDKSQININKRKANLAKLKESK